jgi:hypothetical protein
MSETVKHEISENFRHAFNTFSDDFVELRQIFVFLRLFSFYAQNLGSLPLRSGEACCHFAPPREACCHFAPPREACCHFAPPREACCHFAPPTQRQTKFKGNLIQMALYRHLTTSLLPQQTNLFKQRTAVTSRHKQGTFYKPNPKRIFVQCPYSDKRRFSSLKPPAAKNKPFQTIYLTPLLAKRGGVLSLRAADTEACCHFAPPREACCHFAPPTPDFSKLVYCMVSQNKPLKFETLHAVAQRYFGCTGYQRYTKSHQFLRWQILLGHSLA